MLDRWRAAVEAVKAASPRHGASLAHGRLLALRPGVVALWFAPQSAFHRTTVTAQSGRLAIEKVLSVHLGEPTRLSLEEPPPGQTSPASLAEQDAQSRAARDRSMDASVREHPALRATLKHLGGELEHIQLLEPAQPSAPPALDAADESG